MIKRIHAQDTHRKLAIVLNNAKNVEAKIWSVIGQKHEIPKTIAELQGLIRIASYELKKIEEFDHHLFKVEKTRLAKEIDYDLRKLEKILEAQIEKLKNIQVMEHNAVISVLDGEKQGGDFSQTSQLIHNIIERLEKR